MNVYILLSLLFCFIFPVYIIFSNFGVYDLRLLSLPLDAVLMNLTSNVIF